MEFAIELDINDWKSYNLFLTKWIKAKKSVGWRKQLKSLLLWLAIGVVMATVFSAGGYALHWPTLIAVVIFLALLVFSFLAEVSENQLLMQPEPGGSFLGVHTFRFDDVGIHSSGAHYQATHDWSSPRNLVRENGLILVFVDTTLAFVFPERKLADPSALFDYLSRRAENANIQNHS